MTGVDLTRSHLLWADDSEFDAYVAFERERRARSAERPFGARLSIQCPVRMVQAVYDPTARQPIDVGDGERGHEIESRVRATMFRDVEHEYQPPVVWDYGFSAFDLRTPDGVVWEIKSTIGRVNVHGDHRATTLRRMVAADMSPGQTVQIVVVHPGNYRWSGPHTIELTVDDFDRYHAELGRIVKAFDHFEQIDRPEHETGWRAGTWWRDRFALECACGGCTDHLKMDANDGLERLAFRWGIAMDAIEDAGGIVGGKPSWEWRDDGLRARIIEALDRQATPHMEEARRNMSPIRIQTYGTTRELRATWSPKTERWTIRRAPKPRGLTVAA